jgi:DNA-binding response OmpR family regulator
MKRILLCSSNPILIKSLYGILRDEGHSVETIEHPVLAVQLVMNQEYDVLIIDSEPFGLSAEDAAEIVRTVAPGVSILFVGKGEEKGRVQAVETPVDLEDFKRTIHNISQMA